RGLFGFELLIRVVRRLDRETDAAIRLVNLDDAGSDFLADLEHVLDLVHAVFADLRDVNESVNFVLQADERAEARELGDAAGDEVADLVELINGFPRILADLLEANRDTLIGLVHFEHDGFDFIALLQDFRRMVDLARPRNVRDVDHAIETF